MKKILTYPFDKVDKRNRLCYNRKNLRRRRMFTLDNEAKLKTAERGFGISRICVFDKPVIFSKVD